MNNDSNNTGVPRRFSDVNGPAGPPPSSKPVITPPAQADPMLSAFPSQPSVTPSQPNVAPPQASNPLQPVPEDQGQAPDTGHFGHVRNRRPRGKKVAVFILIFVAIAAALGYGGWIYYQKSSGIDSRTDVPTLTQSTQQDESAASQQGTFTSKSGVYSLNNIYGWKVTEEDTTDKYSGIDLGGAKAVRDTFTIAEGKFLTLSVNPGGRGGGCPPGDNDVPFAAGNVCPSYKIENYEKLPEAQFPKDKLHAKVASAYIINYKYREPDIDQTFDFVGLTSTDTNIRTNQETPLSTEADTGMHFSFSVLPLKTMYIDTIIVDGNGKLVQLTQEERDKVYEVLKTVQLK